MCELIRRFLSSDKKSHPPTSLNHSQQQSVNTTQSHRHHPLVSPSRPNCESSRRRKFIQCATMGARARVRRGNPRKSGINLGRCLWCDLSLTLFLLLSLISFLIASLQQFFHLFIFPFDDFSSSLSFPPRYQTENLIFVKKYLLNDLNAFLLCRVFSGPGAAFWE